MYMKSKHRATDLAVRISHEQLPTLYTVKTPGDC